MENIKIHEKDTQNERLVNNSFDGCCGNISLLAYVDVFFQLLFFSLFFPSFASLVYHRCVLFFFFFFFYYVFFLFSRRVLMSSTLSTYSRAQFVCFCLIQLNQFLRVLFFVFHTRNCMLFLLACMHKTMIIHFWYTQTQSESCFYKDLMKRMI